MKRHVEWLTSEMAAIRLGYQHEDGTANLNAFHVYLHRHPIRSYRLGRRLRFRAVDVDSAVEAMPEARPSGLRLVRAK